MAYIRRKINSKFSYLNVTQHTRQYEHETSGADFELELWILSKTERLSFVFQAKKIIKDYNSYCNKLNYKNGEDRQIDVLTQYAKDMKRLPFYLFYSPSDTDTTLLCMRNDAAETALFMADVETVNRLTKDFKNRRLSKNKILENTNPFHCLFCCPYATIDFTQYLKVYFPNLIDYYFPDDNEVPPYVLSIADNELGDVANLIEENNLSVFRNVGVLDLRYEN